MIKKNLRRIVSLGCAVLTTSSLLSFGAIETFADSNFGWNLEGGTWYWYENGEKQGLEGRGKEIYDPDSDNWYWLDSIQGGAKTTNKDVYQESLSGPWGDIDGEDGQKYGKWVRYDADGHMVKGWATNNDGSVYYFDPIFGTMAKGDAFIDGVAYHFNEVTGIRDYCGISLDNHWEVFDGKEFWYENGIRQGYDAAHAGYRGKEIYDPGSNAWYWLDNVLQGAKAVAKDVYQESVADEFGNKGKWVRYDANGHMIKGWNENENGTYYFDPVYGTMYKGRKEIDGKIYEFDTVTGVLKGEKPNKNVKFDVELGEANIFRSSETTYIAFAEVTNKSDVGTCVNVTFDIFDADGKLLDSGRSSIACVMPGKTALLEYSVFNKGNAASAKVTLNEASASIYETDLSDNLDIKTYVHSDIMVIEATNTGSVAMKNANVSVLFYKDNKPVKLSNEYFYNAAMYLNPSETYYDRITGLVEFDDYKIYKTGYSYKNEECPTMLSAEILEKGSYKSYTTPYTFYEVKNTSDKVERLSILYIYYDANNKPIFTDTDTGSAIAPGQKFIVRTNCGTKVAEDYKYIKTYVTAVAQDRESIYGKITTSESVKEGRLYLNCTNNGSKKTNTAYATVLFYNDGSLISAAENVSLGQIEPGQTGTGSTLLPRTYDRYEVYYTGSFKFDE